MDSLKDILITKNLDEPSEVTALRDYIQQTFKVKPIIKVSERNITVIVSNGKLATELRGRQLDIERRCQLTRRFIVRVSA